MARWLILVGAALVVSMSCSENRIPKLAAHAGDDGSEPAEDTGGEAGDRAALAAGSGGTVASSSAGGGGGSLAMNSGSSASSGSAASAGAEDEPGFDTCTFPEAQRLQNVVLNPGFCAYIWAANVGDARGIKTDEVGTALAISRTNGSIVALWDDDHDGMSGPTERLTIATVAGLNHGLELHAGYLYASSPSTVYRWNYGSDRQPLGPPETVITGMPTSGHNTRTLASDTRFLYVSVGSENNLDQTSSRARVVRFLLATLSANPVAFETGEVFADGLRNNVGLGFDSRGRLWGLDNGEDDLVRADLGGDIHEDNPADELNLFTTPGAFYGFPYCWAEYALPSAFSMGRGSEWANAGFASDGVHTDAWCRSSAVRASVVALESHSAALDVLFYAGHSFPSAYRGGAFIAEHGSHDRRVPSGFAVSFVAFGSDGLPRAKPARVLRGDVPGYLGFRPVGLAVLPNGLLLISSDTGAQSVLALGYTPAR